MTWNTGSPVLENKHIFNAPRSRVFDAWLNREQWQAWRLPSGTDRDSHGNGWDSTPNKIAAYLARAQVGSGV